MLLLPAAGGVVLDDWMPLVSTTNGFDSATIFSPSDSTASSRWFAVLPWSEHCSTVGLTDSASEDTAAAPVGGNWSTTELVMVTGGVWDILDDLRCLWIVGVCAVVSGISPHFHLTSSSSMSRSPVRCVWAVASWLMPLSLCGLVGREYNGLQQQQANMSVCHPVHCWCGRVV